jgi:hypothetical protein
VTERPRIKTAKGAAVPTSLFVDPAYSGVSAIIAPAAQARNPNAVVVARDCKSH